MFGGFSLAFVTRSNCSASKLIACAFNYCGINETRGRSIARLGCLNQVVRGRRGRRRRSERTKPLEVCSFVYLSNRDSIRVCMWHIQRAPTTIFHWQLVIKWQSNVARFKLTAPNGAISPLWPLQAAYMICSINENGCQNIRSVKLASYQYLLPLFADTGLALVDARCLFWIRWRCWKSATYHTRMTDSSFSPSEWFNTNLN